MSNPSVLFQQEEETKEAQVDAMTNEICLSLTIAIPKALKAEGFVRFIELEKIVRPILEKRLR